MIYDRPGASVGTGFTLRLLLDGCDETELEMVKRHVRRGREIVARQRATVERLQAGGSPAAQAEALLSGFQRVQYLHEDLLARTEERNRCRWAERQRFMDWTFDKELDQIECWLGAFDRNSPIADVAEARKLIALLSIINNTPEMDASFPRLFGHDMHWWVDCISLGGDSERWLRTLGICAAVDAWSAAEHNWNWSRVPPPA
jgi:hypothetical protein